MVVKNHIIKSFRVDSETKRLIKMLTSFTGFKESRIVRWLFHRAIEELKYDIQKAQGIENLRFNLKQINNS